MAAEKFYVHPSNAVNATLLPGDGTGFIFNDDNPSCSAANYTPIGNPTTCQVVVNFATADGTATAGSDYTGVTTGSVIFPAGTPSDTTKPVPVAIINDTADEPDETLMLTLSSRDADIGAVATHTLTIQDNDDPPTLAVGDASITESDSGVLTVSVPVQLSAASGRTVSVGYATANLVPPEALAGTDYVAKTGTLTFVPGDIVENITIQITGEQIDEDNERFQVNLNSPQNATIADGAGIVTIVDNDNPPAITVGSASVIEGNTGTVSAVFAVTIPVQSSKTITASYSTVAGTAAAGTDFAAASGSITIPIGQTAASSVSVAVSEDTDPEDYETFQLALSNPLNATVVGPGTGTIQNDDTVVEALDVSVTEGDTQEVVAGVVVRLTKRSALAVGVSYSATASEAGQATANVDYVPITGTVTFSPGDTNLTRTVQVAVLPDLNDEFDETFKLGLGSLSNATLGHNPAIVTILDNDAEPTVQMGSMGVLEGTASSTPAQFSVYLSRESGKEIRVDYQTLIGTANEKDYEPTSGTVIINAGQRTGTLSVNMRPDSTSEPAEKFYVHASSAVNATLLPGDGTGVIFNDDNPNCPAANYTASPTSAKHRRLGGTGSASITVPQTGCDWAAVAVEPWLNVVGADVGGGNASINYGVAPNTWGVERTGRLLIQGRAVTITQSLAENVVWNEATAVNVAITGNSLRKSTGEVGFNAGAVSKRELMEGFGYMEFGTADVINGGAGEGKAKIAGFTNVNTGGARTDLRFGLMLQENGLFKVYEAGTGEGALTGTYQAGDRFRIQVEPNSAGTATVRYLKVGAVGPVEFSTTNVPMSGLFPLWVDSSLKKVDAQITDVIMAGNLPNNVMPVARINPNPTQTFPDQATAFIDDSTDADGTVTGWLWDFGDGGTSTLQNPSHVYQGKVPETYTVTLTVTDNLLGQATTQRSILVADPNDGQDVTWTKLKGVAPVAPSGLIKTLNNIKWTTGAFTSQSIIVSSAPGWIEYTVPVTGQAIFMGLSKPGAKRGASGLGAGLRFYNAIDMATTARIMEKGDLRESFTYGPGDRFRITANPNHTVTYQRYAAGSTTPAATIVTTPTTPLPDRIVGHVGIRGVGNRVSRAVIQGIAGPPNVTDPPPDEFDLNGEVDDAPSDDPVYE